MLLYVSVFQRQPAITAELRPTCPRARLLGISVSQQDFPSLDASAFVFLDIFLPWYFTGMALLSLLLSPNAICPFGWLPLPSQLFLWR